MEFLAIINLCFFGIILLCIFGLMTCWKIIFERILKIVVTLGCLLFILGICFEMGNVTIGLKLGYGILGIVFFIIALCIFLSSRNYRLRAFVVGGTLGYCFMISAIVIILSLYRAGFIHDTDYLLTLPFKLNFVHTFFEYLFPDSDFLDNFPLIFMGSLILSYFFVGGFLGLIYGKYKNKRPLI